MQTLIGQRIGQWPDNWTFDSMKEFVSFKVINVSEKVGRSYRLRGNRRMSRESGPARNMISGSRLTYGSLVTRQKLVQVEQLQSRAEESHFKQGCKI